MTSTPTPPDDHAWLRRTLILVVLGAMVVSISGQVQSIETKLGFWLAVVFAVVNDIGAIMALNVSLSAPRKSRIRRWAWCVILLTAGTGGALNWWHTSVQPVLGPDGEHHLPPLPAEFGPLVGLEPIVLVLVLSHLIGLVIAERRAGLATARVVDRENDDTASSLVDLREEAVTRPRVAAATMTGGTASSPASLVVTTGAQERERPVVTTASSRSVATASRDRRPVVRQSVRPARSPDAPTSGWQPWMTEDLLAAVVSSMRQAGAPAKRYGEPRLRAEHRLGDGSPISSYRAQALLRYIDTHDLLRASA